MVRNIGTVFHYKNKDRMKKIITTRIRPKLEYAETEWSSHEKKHGNKLEGMINPYRTPDRNFHLE